MIHVPVGYEVRASELFAMYELVRVLATDNKNQWTIVQHRRIAVYRLQVKCEIRTFWAEGSSLEELAKNLRAVVDAMTHEPLLWEARAKRLGVHLGSCPYFPKSVK